MPISFMSPVSLILSVMCSAGTLGWECRTQPECWNVLYSYSCYQRNFGDIHTPEYNAAIKSGHNVKPRLKSPKVIQAESRKILPF